MEIIKVNELSVKVTGERDILTDIYDNFSYQVPGHRFMPQFKYRTLGPEWSTYSISRMEYSLLGW